MPKITDGFFNFLAKIYDKKEVGDMLTEFQRDNPDPEKFEEPSWVAGWVRLPFSEIKSWSDDTIDHQTVKEVADKGHDATYLTTYGSGNFECLWKKEKFEDKLNEAYEYFEKNFPDKLRKA